MVVQSEEYILDPLVSVVIITYNQETTIAQTIESILFQKCNFPFEIIIGEDCGIDRTREICIEYQKRYPQLIKLILFEKNGGVVTNWLGCIKEAKGKYITTCAGDDYWHNPQKLQLQVDYMDCHINCGVLHTDYDDFDVKTKRVVSNIRRFRKDQITQGYVQNEIFNGALTIVAPTACIRKELFEKYIPAEIYLELNFPIEDWPTWVILSKYSEVNYLPISTVTYRKGHESLSNLKSCEKLIEKFVKEKVMYKYLCDKFPDELPFDEQGYDAYVHHVLLGLAYKKLDFPSARKYGSLLSAVGNTNLKVKCSTTIFTFYSYGLALKIRDAFQKC
jgi:glycosyltransferase involved in cell wall biosynthesis